MATFDTVRSVALTLPDVVEGTYFRGPAFRVGKKYFATLRPDEETVVVQVGFDYRDMLLRADPDVYFITDHYQGYPGLVVRLKHATEDDLREVVEQAWRYTAPEKLVASHDAGNEVSG